MKRSNPKKNVPRPDTRQGADDFEGGDVAFRSRSTTDVAGAGDRRRKRSEMAEHWSRRRIQGERGSLPVSESPPRPPPVLVFYEDLEEKLKPAPVYGQYPRAFIKKILPWLRCDRREVLHVCSGSLPPGEGIRVDIRPTARPDIIADGRALPFRDGSMAAVLIDPPYTPHYARELYGVDYPRPSHLLREASRVVRPGGRVCIVHYITPKPPTGLRFVKSFGLSTGFDMPIRAVTIYQRPDSRAPLLELADRDLKPENVS